MGRMPAECALLPQDITGSKGVAAVQRDGVVEDVQDSHDSAFTH